MTEEIKKIIAVIQMVEKKKLWILNCVLSGMEILKAHVDDKSQTVLKMEKASVLDYIKKVPGTVAPPTTPDPSQGKEPTKEDLEKQIQQVENIKEALEQEKEELEKKKKKGKKEDKKEKEDKKKKKD